MNYDTIKLDISDSIARITLDRPDNANALNAQMMRDLLDVSIRLDEDDSVRAVSITGNGRFFCAGGDLHSFAEAGDQLSPFLKRVVVELHAAISRFARMQKPVITVINGPAAGAGLSLAIMGDYTISAESAQYTLAYTAAGLSPDGSSTYFLPRLVGEKRARELMLTNRTLSATEALDWGLVNQVVADSELQTEADKFLAKMAKGPTKAYGKVKELLVASSTNSLETQMDIEGYGIASSAKTADGKEGVDAFLNKRKPEFTGQ